LARSVRIRQDHSPSHPVMERKIKYWIRILFTFFILSIVNRIWTVVDYRGVSEDWTYSPERRFKIKDQIIVNKSQET
jgi:hypothetical protein